MISIISNPKVDRSTLVIKIWVKYLIYGYDFVKKSKIEEKDKCMRDF